ncbi:MAG TPA: hypothetical protein VK079_04000 [Bacillota bacterium]|nr:hypothetical protein [Bacillota bacterium]
MPQALRKILHHLPTRTAIKGKTNQNLYIIKQKINTDRNIATYMCTFKGKHVILKIAEQTKVMQQKINVLREIHEVQDDHLGPSLLDIDEWCAEDGHIYLFYVLEHIKGSNLTTFFQRKQRHWLPLIIIQLLDQLTILHKTGFVIGQLTADHLFMTNSPDVRFDDLSHAVRIGDYIQQRVNFFDVTYWGLGSKKAEQSNDLFAVVMLILHIYYPEKFSRTNKPRKQLITKIDQLPLATLYKQCFLKAAFGTYTTASEMKAEFLKAITVTEDIRSLPDNQLIKRKKVSLSEATTILLVAFSYCLSAYIYL